MTTNSSVVPEKGPDQQAGDLLPYYARIAGKPVLVWRHENGILSCVDATGKKSAAVADKVKVERLGDAQVLQGQKGRYAVLRTAVVDLANGNFVAKEVEAAIRAHLAKASPVAPAPAPTPAPAPAPAPVSVAPTPVTWSLWEEVKDAPTRIYDYWLQESLCNSWDDKAMGEMRKDLAEAVLESALSGSASDLEEALKELAEKARGLCGRMEAIIDNDYSTVTPICWIPLTTDLEIQVDGLGDNLLWANVSAADANAFARGEFRVSLTQERGLVVGIQKADDIEVIAELNLAIEENMEFVANFVWETFGYHPDQLTLF